MSALTMDRLAPVSLDELNATSALLTRIDRKYVLDEASTSALLDRLPSHTRQLEIDGRRAFGYHSLYFDTPSLEAFRGTAHRRRRRYKVRIRSYDTGLRFLEVKTRRGAHTVKERTECEHLILDGDGAAFVFDRLAAARIVPDGPLDPALTTEYRRRTFVLGDGARLTVDSDLTWHTAADSPGAGPGDRRDQVGGASLRRRSLALGRGTSSPDDLQVRHRPRRPPVPSPPQPLAPAAHHNPGLRHVIAETDL